MAKLGTNRTRQAKVYDREYGETAKTHMPTAGDVSSFDSLLQEIATNVLRDKIQAFRPEFMDRTAETLGQRFKDILLPQGTRFYRQGSRAVAFAIEVPPSVRTLNFRGGDGMAAPYNGKWNLALPYLYFIPIFGVDNNENRLSAVCLGCRTEPLESPDDMLYCMNLPNAYHLHAVPGRLPAEGIIPGLQNMTICQGYVHERLSRPFEAKWDTFNKMTQEVITHYWSSRFTNELTVVYSYMQGKEPQHFASLDTWQAKSREDPLFVLKVKYPPAIRLNRLFDDIMATHDHGSGNVAGQITSFLGRIYDEVWQEIQRDENYQKVRVNLGTQVIERFGMAMQKFGQVLSMNLSSINNETIKRHVLLAIQIALREAVK